MDLGRLRGGLEGKGSGPEGLQEVPRTAKKRFWSYVRFPRNAPDLINIVVSAFFEKKLFCIRRRLEATRRGLGKWVHRSGLHSKKPCNFKGVVKKFFEASRSAEGAPQMAAGPNHSIFTGSRATARIPSFLQGRRPRGGILPYKNEGILFRDTTAERRSEDGTFSLSWGVPWGPRRPPKEVWKIRGGHPNSRQLESLHFYSVP